MQNLRCGLQRYRRKLYRDPITGDTEWGVVSAPDGGVMSVDSLPERAPIKRSGFDEKVSVETNAQRYADWRFVYVPQATGSLGQRIVR